MINFPKKTSWLLLLLVVGCGSDDPLQVVTITDTDAGFVPLAVGHSWTYNATQTITITFLDGSPSPPPNVSTVTETRTMTGFETFFEREYVVEERTFASPQGDVRLWRRLRQDETGLYAAQVPEDSPPALRLTAAAEEEAVHLQYPLEENAEWTVRTEPLLERAFVEGTEILSLPIGSISAFRVRIENGTLGPNDSAHRWYGECGLLRTRVRREFTAMDPGTGVATRVVTEVDEELTAFEPVGNRTCPVENR
jgi:hypothetical protein